MDRRFWSGLAVVRACYCELDGVAKQHPIRTARPVGELFEFCARPIIGVYKVRSLHQMCGRITRLRDLWIVTTPGKQTFQRKQSNSRGEFGILGAEVAGPSDERRWVGSMC